MVTQLVLYIEHDGIEYAAHFTKRQAGMVVKWPRAEQPTQRILVFNANCAQVIEMLQQEGVPTPDLNDVLRLLNKIPC